MRIKKLLFVFVAGLILFGVAACVKPIDKYADNISELRDNVYVAENETYRITAITGVKESPYVLDGHSSEKQDFTVITLEPKNYEAGVTYTYSTTINGVEYNGNLSQHPFGKSYSVDIKARAQDAELKVVIGLGGNNTEFTLISIKTGDMITADKALEIAGQKLKKQIASLEAGGKLCAEIYIRLIANPIDNSGGYHWYVAYIGEAQDIYAVLINPITMEIVAKRD